MKKWMQFSEEDNPKGQDKQLIAHRQQLTTPRTKRGHIYTGKNKQINKTQVKKKIGNYSNK